MKGTWLYEIMQITNSYLGTLQTNRPTNWVSCRGALLLKIHLLFWAQTPQLEFLWPINLNFRGLLRLRLRLRRRLGYRARGVYSWLLTWYYSPTPIFKLYFLPQNFLAQSHRRQALLRLSVGGAWNLPLARIFFFEFKIGTFSKPFFWI